MSNCNPCGTTNHLVKAVVRQELEETTEDLTKLQESLSNFTNSLVEILTAKYPKHYFNEVIVQLFEDYKPTILEAMRIPEFAQDLAQMKETVAEYGIDMDNILREAREILDGYSLTDDNIYSTFNTLVPGVAKRTQSDINKQNISILDFFTESELENYKTNPTTFDAARPIQAFFDYISVNACGIVNVEGKFAVSKGITFTPETNSKTLQLVGVLNLTMTTNFEGDVLMHVAAGENLNWKGGFMGRGPWNYSLRKCKVGFLLGDTKVNASYGHIDMINCLGFKHYSVQLANLTSNMYIGYIFAHGGGSGSSYSNYGVPAITISNRVDINTGGIDQKTTLTVSELPPIDAPSAMHLYVEGGENGTEMYTITDIDRAKKTISIVPNLDRTLTSSISARYMFGAGLYTRGSDASVVKIGKIWVAGCYAGIYQAALYAADIGTIISEENTATMVLGSGLSAAVLAGTVSYYYTESNNFDLIVNTRFMPSFKFLNSVTFNIKKTLTMGRLRDPNTNAYSAFRELRGVTGVSDGFEFKANLSLQERNPTSTLEILTLDTSTDYLKLSQYIHEYTLNIADFNQQYYLKESLGYTSHKVNLISTANYVNQPLVTFKAPDNVKFINTDTDTIQFKVNRPIELEFIVVSRTSIYVKFDDLEKVKTEAVNAAKTVILKGTTAARPVAPVVGERYYDTTLLTTGKPISWNGSAWVDALGEIV